jgi:putative spermidine/putrescine transport system substrate-binding protein
MRLAMQKSGKADATALAKLPPVTDASPFAPTPDQVTKAKGVVTQNWAPAIA